MEDLFEELLLKDSKRVQDKFYRRFSSLKPDENKGNVDTIIKKTWDLIGTNVLSKDILYLSLLVHGNLELMEKCISWDKTILQANIKELFFDPYLLFDYTVYTKKHWCYEFFQHHISAKEPENKSFFNKFSYLHLISITNDSLSENFNMPLFKMLVNSINSFDNDVFDTDSFWHFYFKEMQYTLNIVEIFKAIKPDIDDFEVLKYSNQNCILEVASKYLNLCENHSDFEFYFFDRKNFIVPHDEDIIGQYETLIAYSVLNEFLKLIIPNDKSNSNVNVNDKIDNIQKRLLNIKNHTLQIELLQLIFATIFIKFDDIFEIENASEAINPYESSAFICNEKEIRIILFTLKYLIDEIKIKNIYTNNSEDLDKLNNLHKIVTDATWRLDLIVNLKSSSKCAAKLLYYMSAERESLINICLKCGDFTRASQVLKIFSLESSPLAREVIFTEKLQELKETFKRTIKMREIHQATPNVAMPNINLQFDVIVEEFLEKNPVIFNKQSDEVIKQHLQNYAFLDHYKYENELFMNIFDLAITQTETLKDSGSLIQLASKYNNLSQTESAFSKFSSNLFRIFNEIATKLNLTLPEILLKSEISLNPDKFQKQEKFYDSLEDLYDEFCNNIAIDEEGIFNKEHPCHKTIQKLNKYCMECLEDKSTGESTKYLLKLFNYLKAFSKVLYIEQDSSELISNGKNTSYFDLLFHNRSELMGKLLFQHNLDPTEFERYFGKLKLDFLYHVTGNCFPTINLHSDENVLQEELYPENILYAPTKAVITYIQKRNWLLALILNEIYKVTDVEIDVSASRIRNFLNYLKQPKMDHLQALFKGNEIITALQNEINYQKVHDYVYGEIEKQEQILSTQSSDSSQSVETGEEIHEDELKTTNWKKLIDIIDSIPENQIKKEHNFILLKDMVLLNLVKDSFECEYYKFTMDISDRNARIDLLLENMQIWPEDFCLTLIKSEISRFDQQHDDKIKEIKVWLKYIQHSKKVMNILGVPTWADMYNLCASQPKDFLEKLLASKEIDLLIEFVEFHEISDNILMCIDEEFLENAFDLSIALTSIEGLLNIIPSDHSIKMCQNLLNILKNVDHLKFVTDYLLINTRDEDLRNVALSLKILSVFPASELDQQLLLLLRDPVGIIEVLIMNTKLDRLAAVLDLIKPIIPVTDFNEEAISVEKIDELIRRYAEKSLDFRIITQPNPRLLRTPEHKLLQSLDTLNLDPSAKAFIMPDNVPTKEEWMGNTDVIECMCCMSVFFSMFNRRHHCRRCGRVVCGSCSNKRMIVPTYGDILVRVCSDCYKQTIKDQSISDDTTSTKTLDDYWILTNDPEHNRILREEFSYEFAPSVSLCLSLMKFHSKCEEYSRFLLNQCEILLKLLIPTQEPMQEIDYLLVIRMLKSLAMAAKMTSQDTSLQYGSSLVDRILDQADLMGLLAERGCLHVLPTSGTSSFIDPIALRRLTDKLLETEQWNLALEVSTKAGLDKSGVFVAWGKSCLKAGSLAMAREKFRKCLDKNSKRDSTYYQYESSSVKAVTNPPLLNEIIKILESKKEHIDDDIVMTIDNQRLLLGSTMTLNQSVASTSQPDAALFILNKLKNIKNIEAGNYSTKKPKDTESTNGKLQDFIYDECVYYLNKYGTPSSLAEFHIKHGSYYKALEHVKSLDFTVKKQSSADIFVKIYMKCLEDGKIKDLQSCMSEMDSTLITWKDHLIQTCVYLKRQNLSHSLYQLQQYMGDYIRAAMSCVGFYEEKASSYTDLLHNNHFLQQAEKHFKQAEEQEQWIEVSPVKDELVQSKPTFEEKSIANPMIKKLSHEEIEKHTATIRMQIEVTKFLANCETNGIFPMQIFLEIFPNKDNIPRNKISIPTLFGSPDQRKYFAVLCIICGNSIAEGFELALRIINKFDLKPIKVYNEAGKYLAKTDKYDKIAELVNCIHKSSDTTDRLVSEMCDEMLVLAVATLTKTSGSEANVKELITLISDKSAKISAYIEAKQLKNAYALATNYRLVSDIRRVMREAEITNQPIIRNLCQKALQTYQ